MKIFFYALIAVIVLLSLKTLLGNKKNAETPEGRFLKACILEHRGALKFSDAKEVCECILAQAKNANIDLDVMAYEYKKHSMDPYSTFGDDKMRDINNECLSSVMTSGNSRETTANKKQGAQGVGNDPLRDDVGRHQIH